MNEPKRWRLELAYDGTDYFGWQVQPGRATIQGVLAEAVKSITGEETLPQGSGRTDAGVHAQGQVASMAIAAEIPEANLMRALNRILPSSIRVTSATVVSAKFHARSNVVSKTYQYRIFRRRPEPDVERVCSPETARFVWDCPLLLDVAAMQTAAAAIIGAHDFTSFAAFDPDRSARMKAKTLEPDEKLPTNVRLIHKSEWVRRGDELIYTVNGSGFLHHMVRNLVGTFVEIGVGRFPADAVPAMLEKRDRGCTGATAPPQGLSLVKVFYKDQA